MDFKNTLNLPVTSFPMKADLPKREPVLLKKWEEKGLYFLLRQKNAGKKSYVLHDGPPYANGDIHMGHALNKILKDIIVRYKALRGFDTPYVPGWDCHGLPVEHQLLKELKIAKHEIDAVSFRKKAAAYALKFVSKQRDQFKRLGVLGDWEHPYLTLNPDYEAAVIEAFAQLVEKNFVYQSLKPVHWCAACETALAEAELEYDENHESPSLTVKFPIPAEELSKRGLAASESTAFAVWTTTPWTLAANVAVAVHPDLEYAALHTEKFGVLIGLETLMTELLKRLDPSGEPKILYRIKGRQLEGVLAKHPFFGRDSVCVLADYVSHTDGTGCVHTAPGHGADDFRTGEKYRLPVLMPVDEKGRFTDEADFLKGEFVTKANERIVGVLAEKGTLIECGRIQHSYPTCWRCKKPVISRATQQWFMGVDRTNLRQRVLEIVHKDVRWFPSTGENRIAGMLESRPDWCLSRQRTWGIPIPVFYCGACKKSILDPELIRRVRDLFAKEGSDSWFIKTAAEIAGDRACGQCGSKELKKGQDILDVWFESGASQQAVLTGRDGLHFPAELYLEGSDQHRGWFQSSLLVSAGTRSTTPYKAVLTHGFIVDGEGRKMSKSLGNVISPLDVMNDTGADILRLWVVSSDTSDDIRISKDNLARLAEGYRKIRNTFKYILGNLNGFTEQDRLSSDQMPEIDRWALSKLEALKDEVSAAYEDFELHRVYQAVHQFCIKEMSSFYLDVLKDRLYTDARSSISGRACRTVLADILNGMTKMLAPVLVFTCDEVWEASGRQTSVHLEAWPESFPGVRDRALEARWERFLGFREKVLKALEEHREKKEIGNSLEADVELSLLKRDDYDFLTSFGKDLPGLLLVSDVRLSPSKENASEETKVTVRKASGQKCERCWAWRPSVGQDKEFPGLCVRCAQVIRSEIR